MVQLAAQFACPVSARRVDEVEVLSVADSPCLDGELTLGVFMNRDPSVVVFDVNETLSDMSPMARRFADVGAPEHLAKLWFATLLRDGFALTAARSAWRRSLLRTSRRRVTRSRPPSMLPTAV